ncbi:MAG: hypothetical protein AB1546_08725 [bacterium]
MKGSPHAPSLILIDVFIILFVFLIHLVFFLNRWVTDFYFAGYVDSNLHYFHDYVVRMADGSVPYRDFPIEYPPLAVLFLWLLRPFADSFKHFETAFITVMLVFSILCLIVWKSAQRGAPATQTISGGVSYGLAVLAVGPITLVSVDYIPAFFTALCLLLLCRGRLFLSGLCLGAAAAAKGYPVILLPVALFIVIKQHKEIGLERLKQFKQFNFILLGFLASLAASVLPAMLMNPSGFLKSYTYHFERAIELGSAYSALLLPLRFAGVQFITQFDHGSWNLSGNIFTSAANRISPFILLSLLAFVYFRIFTTIRVNPRQSMSNNLFSAQSFAVAIAAFILGFKVGSPQFLVWLLPFIPYLVKGTRGWLMLALFVLIGHLQQWIFPWHWSSLVHLNTLPIIILLVEKLLMVIFFIVLVGAHDRAPLHQCNQRNQRLK